MTSEVISPLASLLYTSMEMEISILLKSCKGDEKEVNCNAQMTTALIQKYCKLDDECTQILKKAIEKYGYSARVIHKLLRLARTSADLDGVENIRREDITRVIHCRDLDISSSKMYAIT